MGSKLALLGGLLTGLLNFGLQGCSSRQPPRPDETRPSRDDYFLKIHKLKRIAPDFQWPVKYIKPSSFFGWREGTRLHDGIDLRGPAGTRIYAAADGTVIYVQSRISCYGKMVIIDHGGRWSTMYAHLSRYRVVHGSKVKKGQLIGLMGRTGRATGVHLHFEVRYGADPLDPMLFLPEIK